MALAAVRSGTLGGERFGLLQRVSGRYRCRIAPDDYKSTPAVQEKLQQLREYLNRGRASQSTIKRAYLLWASTKLPGLLEPKQQKERRRNPP